MSINKVKLIFAFLKKIMKKIILIAIAVCLYASGLFAQDAKAKSILDAVSTNLKNLKSLKANYTLSISKTKETKKGTIAMKGTKYYVTVGNDQEIFCDSKSITTYKKKDNEATITEFDPKENSLTPNKL